VSERIAAVVFDIHGVLLDWDPRYLYRTLFADKEAMEHFLIGPAGQADRPGLTHS
jgi:2-haloacid dehalogenase